MIMANILDIMVGKREREMRKSKWLLSMGLAAAFGLVFTAGVYAQDILNRVDAYLRPDFNIIVDGIPLNLEHSALVYNDASYLPLKELGTVLGANITWKGETNTIYVNSRINPEQPGVEGDQQYDQITMLNPMGMYVDYLGQSYIMMRMLSARESYYRDSDLRAMGIDTNGLKKVQEKYTKWLFVAEKEAKLRWKQAPTPNYSNYAAQSKAPTTETDPKKLKGLRDFMKDWGSFKLNGKMIYTQFVITDKLTGDNSYRILASENGHYYFYNVQLVLYDANNADSDYLRNSSKEDIQAGYPDTDPYGQYR